ncbi:MAG TPA: hypothetical protein VMH79_01680 [Thermoanaerobaculia bacterium]|nr:hypothetical protein [Thermoanaerobaculia bacterium]
MKRALLLASMLLAAGLPAGCASGGTGHTDPGLGRRTLDCVVVQREHDSAGSSASSYRGSGTGSYYMVFETREGQATSRYRLEVTHQQYLRFEEGDRVKITLDNNILVNVQPNND